MKNCFLVLFIVVAFAAASPLITNRFVIGAYDGRTLVRNSSVNTDLSDSLRLQSDLKKISKAGINLLIPHSTWWTPWPESYVRMRHLLKGLKNFPGLFLVAGSQESTPIESQDWGRFKETELLLKAYRSPVGWSKPFGNKLKASDLKQVALFNLGDEPWGREKPGPIVQKYLQDQASMMRIVYRSDTNLVPWVNQLAARDIGYLSGCDPKDGECVEQNYRNWVRDYLKMPGSRILTVTNYYQLTNTMASWSWKTMQICAEEVKRAENHPVFWPVLQMNTSFPGRISSRTYRNYLHRVNSSLVHGAKGFLWFEFYSRPKAGWGLSAGDDPEILQMVSSLNRYALSMAPEIMKLKWDAVVHSSPNSGEVTELGVVESNLPVVGDKTQILTKFRSMNQFYSNDFVAGIYRGKFHNYLMIMNKRRDNSGSAGVEFQVDHDVFLNRYDSSTQSWKSLNNIKKRDFQIQLYPAEMMFLKMR